MDEISGFSRINAQFYSSPIWNKFVEQQQHQQYHESLMMWTREEEDDNGSDHEKGDRIASVLIRLGYAAEDAYRVGDSLVSCGFSSAMGSRSFCDRSASDDVVALMDMVRGVRFEDLADAGMRLLDAVELVNRCAAYNDFDRHLREADEVRERIRESGFPKRGDGASRPSFFAAADAAPPVRDRPGVVCMRFKLPPQPLVAPKGSANNGGEKLRVRFSPSAIVSANDVKIAGDESGISELVEVVESASIVALGKGGGGRKQMQLLAESIAQLAIAVNDSGMDDVAVRLGPLTSSQRLGEESGSRPSGGDAMSKEPSTGPGELLTPKELFVRAVRVDSLHGPSYLGLARILANSESARLHDGRVMTKLDAAKEAIRLLPSHHEAYLSLANALLSDPAKEVTVSSSSEGGERKLDCRRALLHALQLRPTSAEAFTKLGTVMQRSETLQLLPPVASQLLSSPGAYGARRKQVFANSTSIDADNTVTKRLCYVRAAQADPCYAPAYFGLGSLLGATETVDLENGVTLSKRECFIQTLALNPRHSLARSSLAMCLRTDEEVSLPDGTIVSSLNRHNPRCWMPPPALPAPSTASQSNSNKSDHESISAQPPADGDDVRSLDRQLREIAGGDAVKQAKLANDRKPQYFPRPSGGPSATRSSSLGRRGDEDVAATDRPRKPSIILKPYRSASGSRRNQ